MLCFPFKRREDFAVAFALLPESYVLVLLIKVIVQGAGQFHSGRVFFVFGNRGRLAFNTLPQLDYLFYRLIGAYHAIILMIIQ